MAGTRLLIISSFILPLLLYVSYVVIILCWDDFPPSSSISIIKNDIQMFYQQYIFISKHNRIWCTIICPVIQQLLQVSKQEQDGSVSSSLLPIFQHQQQLASLLPQFLLSNHSIRSSNNMTAMTEPWIVFITSSSSSSSALVSSSILSGWIHEAKRRKEQKELYNLHHQQQQYQIVEINDNDDDNQQQQIQRICYDNYPTNINNRNGSRNLPEITTIVSFLQDMYSNTKDNKIHYYYSTNESNNRTIHKGNNTFVILTCHHYNTSSSSIGTNMTGNVTLDFVTISDHIGVIYFRSKNNQNYINDNSDNDGKDDSIKDGSNILTTLLFPTSPHYYVSNNFYKSNFDDATIATETMPPAHDTNDFKNVEVTRTAKERLNSMKLPSFTISKPKTIHVSAIFDPLITNWKDYLYYIQQWIDNMNYQNTKNYYDDDYHLQHPLLITTICMEHYLTIPPKIVLSNIQRSNDLFYNHITMMNGTSLNADKRKQQNYLYITISAIEENLLTSDLYRHRTDDSIILYITAKPTYINLSSKQTLNQSESTNSSMSATTSIKMLLDDKSSSSSQIFISIINLKETIKSSEFFSNDASTVTVATTLSSVLDSIYNHYYLDCLNIPTPYTVDTTISTSTTIVSFFTSLLFHRTFYWWYQTIIDNIVYIEDSLSFIYQLLLHKQGQHYTCCAHEPQYLFPIRHIPKKYQQIHESFGSLQHSLTLYNCSFKINDIIDPSCYQHINTNLERIDGLMYDMLRILDDVEQYQERPETDLHHTATINNLDIHHIIHDFPIEQYLAVLGPLLFPLIIPMVISFIREYIRYRKLILKKKSIK